MRRIASLSSPCCCWSSSLARRRSLAARRGAADAFRCTRRAPAISAPDCHFDPNGGGPRNDFGFAFARNRHSLEPEPEGEPVEGSRPHEQGRRQDAALLRRSTSASCCSPTAPAECDGLDRLRLLQHGERDPPRVPAAPRADAGLHRATRSRRSGCSPDSKDAFGMIGGLPWNALFARPGASAIRSGCAWTTTRSRPATRSSTSAPPSRSCPTIRAARHRASSSAATRGPFYGRLAFTNGDANV